MSREKQMHPTDILLLIRLANGKGESLLKKIVLECVVKKEEAKKEKRVIEFNRSIL
jgi:hypothetical protein